MDLRTERTRKNITQAFIELRRNKPIEKITVKELAALAYINKATFYRHYEDIYALSEEIENQLIKNDLNYVTEKIQLFEKKWVSRIVNTLQSQGEVFYIIFSDSRKDEEIHKIHDYLLNKILSQYPEFYNDLEKRVILSTLIYGTFQSYRIYKEVNIDSIINILIKINRILA